MNLPFLSRHPRVALVRLQGTIAARPGFGGGISLATSGPVLDRAFGLKRLSAVFLVINSPGGSPVQSSLVAARIRRLGGHVPSKPAMAKPLPPSKPPPTAPPDDGSHSGAPRNRKIGFI